ncbi:MAG: carboxypeptidase regulatory-like domain-containing protein [Candidatus Sumerlaeaceae bacterium]|nr:carboxypeptidase regulatory-like domain-containing protein [Candidatus Sumerlaeaceae bacterium]
MRGRRFARIRWAVCIITALVVAAGCGRRPAESSGRNKGADPKDKARITSLGEGKPSPTTRNRGTLVTSSPDTLKPFDVDPGSTSPRVVFLGTVRDQTGQAVGGANIKVQKTDYRTAGYNLTSVSCPDTNDRGAFALSLPEGAEFTISVRKPGLIGVQTSVILREDMPQFQTLGPSRQIIRAFTLNLAARITGKVVNDTDQPVPGTPIIATAALPTGPSSQARDLFSPVNEFTTSTADGTFALDEMGSGSLLLVADQPDYVLLSQEATAPVEGLVLKLARAGSAIEGTVRQKETDQNVTSATVSVILNPGYRFSLPDLKPRTTTTDDKGVFRFDRLPAGEFGLKPEKKPLELFYERSNEPYPIVRLAEKETTSGVSLFLYGGYTVEGLVSDKATSTPLGGVKVFHGRANPSGDARGGTLTDANGRFKLESVFARGAAVLTAEMEGYLQDRSSNQRSGNGVVRFEPNKFEAYTEIRLQKALTVSGIVQTDAAVPVPGGTVSAWRPDNYAGSGRSAPIKPGGDFTLNVLPNSKLRVKASAPNLPLGLSDLIQIADESVTGVIVKIPGAGSIAGSVVDSDGNSVANAAVSGWMIADFAELGNAFDSVVTGLQSGADGSFSIPNLPSGRDLQFSASKEQMAGSKPLIVNLKPGEAKTDVKLTLRKGHYIAGSVKDKSGNPVKGAQVYATRMNGAEMASSGFATTDEKGRYRIEKLAEGGTFNMGVYVPTDVRSGNKVGVQLDQDNVDFVLEEIKEVKFVGHVVDAKTNVPIADFTVSGVEGVEKDAEHPGTFSVKLNQRMNNGSGMTIESPGYAKLRTTLPMYQRDSSNVEKTYKMGQPTTVVGRTVDNKGNPVGSIAVSYYDDRNYREYGNRESVGKATSDADGRFQIPNVPPSSGAVVAKPGEKLAPVTRDVTVEPGLDADVGDIVLSVLGSLEGKVLQSPGDQPVPEVQVVATQDSSTNQAKPRQAKTDATGSFRFENLQPGSCRLECPTKGVITTVLITSGETKQVTLRVGTGQLNATVMRSGKPVPYSRVTMTPRQTGNLSASSKACNMEGIAKFENLAPGKWLVYVGSVGYGNAQTLVDVEAEKTTEITLTVQTGQLSGIVVDSSGAGVAGAIVSVAANPQGVADDINLGRRINSSRSGDDGRFIFESITAGSYAVSASKEGIGLSPATTVNVVEGSEHPPVRLVLEANGGTLVSTALNLSNGQPVPSAWCYLVGPEGQIRHTARRGDDGIMTITNIPPATYQVEVSAFGFSANSHTVEISSGKTEKIDDVLYEAGSMKWTIRNEDNSPAVGLAVKLTPDDGSSVEKPRDGKTDKNGAFAARGLVPGNYTATATLAAGGTISVAVPIIAHSDTERESVISGGGK